MHFFPYDIDEKENDIDCEHQTYGQDSHDNIAAADFQQILHERPSCSRRYPMPRAVRSHLGWEGSSSIFSRRRRICTIRVFS